MYKIIAMTIDYRLTLSGCSNILIVQDISKCDPLRNCAYTVECVSLFLFKFCSFNKVHVF